jgi:multidrug transporter EmrE-like cation transporter
MAINIPLISEYSPKGIQAAIKDFQRLETKTEKAGFALKKAFVPATAALGALTAAAVPAVAAASDLEESISKVNVIFGEGAEAVRNFSETAATSLGLSQQAVLDAAGTFGTFGKAAGLGGQDLAQFNNDFTTLAADLASFNNTSPEQAIEAIGAALRGESEPLRSYGVLLNDATLKAEALELGIYDGTGALTDQQKILAAQAAIYKQTGDAQGDFQRTQEGLAGQTKIMQAQFADLQAELGKALMPVVMALLPIVADLASWMSENSELVLIFGGVIGGLAAAVIAINFAMKAWIATKAAYAIVSAAATKATVIFNTALFANPIMLVVVAVAALVAGLIILEKKFGLVTAALEGLFGIFEKVKDGIGWLAEKLGLVSDELENFEKTTDTAREQAGDMYESMRDLTSGADDARNQFERANGQIEDFKDEVHESKRPTDKLTEAVDALWKSTDELYRGMFALNPELQRYLDQLDRNEAVRDFNDAVAEFEEVAKTNQEGSVEWEEANAEVYRSLGDVVQELGNIPQETQSELKILVDTGQLQAALDIITRINEGLALAKTQSGGQTALPSMADLGAALQSGGFVNTTTIAPQVPTSFGDERRAPITLAAPTISTISTERGRATVTNNVTVNALNANAETGRRIADSLAAYQRVRGFVN